MKGQSSLEFLAYVSMSMLILAVLYAVIADKQADTLEMQQRENVESISDKFSFNLEMALVQGEGYSREFSLRSGISGQTYTIETVPGNVNITWPGGSELYPTRYEGRKIELDINDSKTLKVKNNETGVFVVEK